MIRATSGGIIVLLVANAVLAQPHSARPAYEVASVKLNTSGSGDTSSDGSKGQIVFANQTLKRLIERAYNVKSFQVTGPAWIEDVRFDIAAKYPPDTKNDDRSLMLRTLIEDRFKLAVHRESKNVPGYALVVARNGFKLKPVEPGESDTRHNAGRVHTLAAKNTSITKLAEIMTRTLGATVVDRSGIRGGYDFELRWAIVDQNPDDSAAATAASLLSALQETLGKLGLRLQPEKIPVEIIVIDRVERVPTEN